VWASFDWVKPVELETALEQQKQLAELVDAGRLVVKTTAVEEALEEWPASQLSRVQSTHSVLIIASEEELSMSRATPMPPPEGRREALGPTSQNSVQKPSEKGSNGVPSAGLVGVRRRKQAVRCRCSVSQGYVLGSFETFQTASTQSS
jgi:hypothetical protein